MPYSAYAVAGSTFEYTCGSPAALTVVKGVSGFTFSGGERGEIDVTGIDDEDQVTIGGRRAKRKASFKLFYDPAEASHAAMLASYDAATATAVACKNTLADAGAATLTYSAYVSNFSIGLEVDGAISADVEITLTTAITTTP